MFNQDNLTQVWPEEESNRTCIVTNLNSYKNPIAAPLNK